MGVSQFRQVLKRRRRLSAYSTTTSESDFDKISKASIDSFPEDPSYRTGINKLEGVHDLVNLESPCIEEKKSTGGMSDRGYSSMTSEEPKRNSMLIGSQDSLDLMSHAKEHSRSVAHSSIRAQSTLCTNGGNISESEEKDNFIKSIVRNSTSSNTSTDAGSVCTLRDSGSSAGLLMTSRTSLDEDLFGNIGGLSHSLKSRSSIDTVIDGEEGHGHSSDMISHIENLDLDSLQADCKVPDDTKLLSTIDNTVNAPVLLNPENLLDDDSSLLDSIVPVSLDYTDSNEDNLTPNAGGVQNNITDANTVENSDSIIPVLNAIDFPIRENVVNNIHSDQTMVDQSMDTFVPESGSTELSNVPDQICNLDYQLCDINAGGDSAAAFQEMFLPLDRDTSTDDHDEQDTTATLLSPTHSKRTPVTENDPLGLFLLGQGDVMGQVDLLGKPIDIADATKDSVNSGVSNNDFAELKPFSNTSTPCKVKVVRSQSDGSVLDTTISSFSTHSPYKSGESFSSSEGTSSLESPAREAWQPLSQNQQITERNRSESEPACLQDTKLVETPARRRLVGLGRSESFTRAGKYAASLANKAFSASARLGSRLGTAAGTGVKASGSTHAGLTSPSHSPEKTLPETPEEAITHAEGASMTESEDDSQDHTKYTPMMAGMLSSLQSALTQSLDSLKGVAGMSDTSALSTDSVDYLTALPTTPSHHVTHPKTSLGNVSSRSTASIGSATASINSSITAGSTAMQVDMCSLSRCSSCQSLLYDEEIMAGWSADDSNLNTICQFCNAKLVPLLQIHVKDFRQCLNQTNTSSLNPAQSFESVQSIPYLPSGQATSAQVVEGKLIELDCSPQTSPDQISEDTEERKSNSETQNAISPTEHRRSNSAGPTVEHRRSASDTAHNTQPAAVEPVLIDPITVPYLSPLVLRKEVETVVEQDGDLSLSCPDFLDLHPILYWNIVWYFTRLDVPSHLPAAVLTAKITNSHLGDRVPHTSCDSRHVLISTLWDNLRMQTEMGQPMYMTWKIHKEQHGVGIDSGVGSTTFQYPLLKSIVSSIMNNDVVGPLKLILDERRRLKKIHPQLRFHSMYRDMLYLSFTALERENIDHDAFDREYRIAITELNPKYIAQMMPMDRAPKRAVYTCRTFFNPMDL